MTDLIPRQPGTTPAIMEEAVEKHLDDSLSHTRQGQ